MKKSLKVIASAAMALSMFSSVAMADTAATTSTTTTAATKTSKDFKDLAGKDAALLAKIDALLASGTFDGVATDTFGIDQNMTRAQVAKVLTLIYNVKVDATVKTSSFSDVKADDTANAWAIPYIEAAKQAGLIDGVTDTTFVPGDDVTLGQFATLLVKGLGKKVDVTGSPWYKDAVDQAVALKLLPAGTDGSKAATRADLVGGAFNGQQAYVDANKPKQVSIKEAKATGAKQVTVTLDRDVDTSKATLSLKRASIAVNTTTKWSDDKKTATLTLTDTTIMASDYTVTLAGLDASEIKTASATFTAQDEQVQKIEFVTSSDTIALANNVVVKVKATNQYGELASASAGSYSYFGDVVKITKSIDGYLLVTLNSLGRSPGVGIVTATIMNTDSHVTVTKNFTVGTTPILSKVELGAPVYSNGTAINGTGDNAKFALNFYDQYGSMINYDTLQATPNWLPTNPVIWNDYLDDQTVKAEIENDGNSNPVLKISLKKNVDKSADYNFTFIDQAATSTGKVSIKSVKLVTKIKVGALTDVIAAGDDNAYVPIEAYDAQGNLLTADDLAADENRDRIMVSSSAFLPGSSTKLLDSGEHKGQIKLDNIPGTKNQSVNVSVVISSPNLVSSDTKNFTVAAARTPDHFLEVTAPAKELVPGGSSAFVIEVIDQYGKPLKKLKQVDSNGTVGTGSNYKLVLDATTTLPSGSVYNTVVGGTYLNDGVTVANSTYALVTGDYDAVASSTSVGSSVAAIGNGLNALTFDSSTTNNVLENIVNDKTFRFAALNTPNAVGFKVGLVAKIYKQDVNTGLYNDISTYSKTVNVTNADTSKLTYSLNSVPALWYAKDSGVIQDQKLYDNTPYGVTAYVYKDDLLLNRDSGTGSDRKFAREVKVLAKNAAGDTVGVPKQIKGISSSDTNVAYTFLTVDPTNSVYKAYVIGNKVGTAKVTVQFVAADGTTKTQTSDVTVKNDALNVANITFDHSSYTFTGTGTSFATVNAFKGNKTGGTYGVSSTDWVNVTDNYGVVYEDGDAQRYNPYLGVQFGVNVSQALRTLGVTASVDNYGNIQVDKHGQTEVTFDVTATSATGKTATTSITLK